MVRPWCRLLLILIRCPIESPGDSSGHKPLLPKQTVPWSHVLKRTWGTTYQNHGPSSGVPRHWFEEPFVLTKPQTSTLVSVPLEGGPTSRRDRFTGRIQNLWWLLNVEDGLRVPRVFLWKQVPTHVLNTTLSYVSPLMDKTVDAL